MWVSSYSENILKSTQDKYHILVYLVQVCPT